MSRPFYKSIDNLYDVIVLDTPPHEVEPDLYDEEDDALEYLAPDYINRLGTEYSTRVIYWESNYDPSAYKLSEDDDPRAVEIFNRLEEYGMDFSTDLVDKYAADYEKEV